jgi:hypothetical protein
MRWLLMLLRTCAATCIGYMLKLSSHMSSPELINITGKQSPVINRLHDTMTQACSYANAIRDNAQDDGIAIPMDLVSSFQDDYNAIITALTDAASV